MAETVRPAGGADSARHVVWQYDMAENLRVMQDHAASCSPLVHGDFVYVCTGNGRFKYTEKPFYPLTPSLIVLNKHTGQLVARDDEQIGEQLWRGQWSSPSLATVNGKARSFLPPATVSVTRLSRSIRRRRSLPTVGSRPRCAVRSCTSSTSKAKTPPGSPRGIRPQSSAGRVAKAGAAAGIPLFDRPAGHHAGRFHSDGQGARCADLEEDLVVRLPAPGIPKSPFMPTAAKGTAKTSLRYHRHAGLLPQPGLPGHRRGSDSWQQEQPRIPGLHRCDQDRRRYPERQSLELRPTEWGDHPGVDRRRVAVSIDGATTIYVGCRHRAEKHRSYALGRAITAWWVPRLGWSRTGKVFAGRSILPAEQDPEKTRHRRGIHRRQFGHAASPTCCLRCRVKDYGGVRPRGQMPQVK